MIYYVISSDYVLGFEEYYRNNNGILEFYSIKCGEWQVSHQITSIGFHKLGTVVHTFSELEFNKYKMGLEMLK